MSLKDEIVAIVKQFPGLTDREITDRVRGKNSPQQPINSACRSLQDAGLFNRRRENGLIRNCIHRVDPGLVSLCEIGFRRMGSWVWRDDKLKIEWNEGGPESSQNALYAFVVDGCVRYVGKTTQGLKKRFYGYQNPKPSQKTNLKVNPLVIGELKGGSKVEVFGLLEKEAINHGPFVLNLAGGLEDDIIKKLDQLWNGRRQDSIS